MTLLRNFGIKQRRANARDSAKEAADTPTERPDIYRFRAIPVPLPEDLHSVVASVEALKEVVETLIGQRHDQVSSSLGKAVLHNDIYKDGAQKDNAGIDNYVRKVPHVVPDIQPDPHPQYIVAAFGGMKGPASVPALDGTWTPITNYPTPYVPVPKFVAVDLVAGTLKLERPGTYVLSVSLALNFTESNAGRTTYLRLFDITDNVALSTELPLFVGRNQGGVTASISVLLYVAPGSVGDAMRMEIGNGDTFAGLSVTGVAFSMYRVGS